MRNITSFYNCYEYGFRSCIGWRCFCGCLPTGAGGSEGGGLGDILSGAGGVVSSVISLLPTALQIYNAIESGAESGVGAILPAFKDGVANFSKAHNVIKTNFHNAVKCLANAKTQSEYTKIYNPLTQMHRQYLKSGDLLNKIKQYSANNDYRSIANELGRSALV